MRSHIIENWESQDEPEHLRTIRDRLLSNEERTGQLLGLYQQILTAPNREGIAADNSPEQVELRLSGLVVKQQGKLRVYNRIYQAVFDQSWVEQVLANLRPYSEAITAWLAANCQDESRLLRGKALQAAQAWVVGKSLSHQDHRFLTASQELEKRNDQIAAANRILAKAQQKARRISLKRWWEMATNLRRYTSYSKGLSLWTIQLFWVGILYRFMLVSREILITASWVAGSVIILRLIGVLQSLELATLDQLFRLRPAEPIDERILIVTIDESDINYLRKLPIPDATLARLIKNLNQDKPVAIGLDLDRDLPVELGHQDWLEVMKSTPNLIGVGKTFGGKVPPSNTLSKMEQVALTGLLVDDDDKVRRALLFDRTSEGQLRYGLGSKLAWIYLKAKDITLESVDDKKKQYRLGQGIFTAFKGNDGGYVRTNSDDYQVLLNYRGQLDRFDTVTLTKVLKKQVEPELIRDRLILIGSIAASLNDDEFYTPYSRLMSDSKRQPTPKVVIHANVTSQIVSAALDERSLLKTGIDPVEWLWIFSWSLIGASLSWTFLILRFPRLLVFIILLAGICLISSCYVAFLYGWWIPLVPTALSLMVSAIVVPLGAINRLEKLQLNYTLELIIESYPQNPGAVRIALESLKQSESKQNQALINHFQQTIENARYFTEPPP
ncbi:MAG: CHASE2 domain-containing protein [Symploca sp. SIO2E6]|nr:CHASE2 domain-containing protein [Symploca sp. SIO2E6]